MEKFKYTDLDGDLLHLAAARDGSITGVQVQGRRRAPFTLSPAETAELLDYLSSDCREDRAIGPIGLEWFSGSLYLDAEDTCVCLYNPDTDDDARPGMIAFLQSVLQPAKAPAPVAAATATQVGGSHYVDMPIQPFTYSMSNKLDPLQHTIVKYVTRFRAKGGQQDLEKAKHCIDLLLQHEYGGGLIALEPEHDALSVAWGHIQRAARDAMSRDGFVEWSVVEARVQEVLDRTETEPTSHLNESEGAASMWPATPKLIFSKARSESRYVLRNATSSANSNSCTDSWEGWWSDGED